MVSSLVLFVTILLLLEMHSQDNCTRFVSICCIACNRRLLFLKICPSKLSVVFKRAFINDDSPGKRMRKYCNNNLIKGRQFGVQGVGVYLGDRGTFKICQGLFKELVSRESRQPVRGLLR